MQTLGEGAGMQLVHYMQDVRVIDTLHEPRRMWSSLRAVMLPQHTYISTSLPLAYHMSIG